MLLVAASVAVWTGQVVLPSTAHAAQKLSISPPFLNVTAAAGDTLTESITASASGDEAITVELVHADFGFDDTYQITLIMDDADETTAFSTRNWFSLPKPRYHIPAGQSRELPLRIAVPDNTPGGTYLGAALLRIVPTSKPESGQQIQAVAQSGPLVFIAVDGGDPPKPKIDTFTVDRLTTGGPITPKLVVRNDGDEYFQLRGSVTLTGPDTDEKVVVRQQYVVPGTPRTVRASSTDRADDSGPIKLGSRQLGFGSYTLTTRLRIEPTGTTLVAHQTIWVIPIWVRLLGVGLAVVLATLLAIGIRRIRARSAFDTPDDELDDDSLDDDSLP